MTIRPRAVIVVATLGFVLLTACSGGSSDVWQSARSTSNPAPFIDQRLGYVSEDYVVFTATFEGRDRHRVAGAGAGLHGVQARLPSARTQGQTNVRYTWPTWSTDGTRVALSRAPGADDAVASLVLIEEGKLGERTLYETRSAPVLQVAAGTYHYAYWSPDGDQIALIAPDESGTELSLFRLMPDNGASDEVLRRAPLYVNWSPDSSSLLIHRGEHLFSHDVATGETRDLGRPSQRYRVPDFNSDGTQFAFVSGDHLRVRDVGTGEEHEIMVVGIEAAFMYSPADPHLLAVTQRTPRTGAGYAELDIIDTNTGETTKLFGGGLLAFYWSPDGRRIMLATGPPVDGLLEWRVADLETGVVTDLMRFAVSSGFLPHLQFFDQFAPSHELWSEDSTRFVFSGHSSSEPGRSSHIWVMDVSGLHLPVEVARGHMAYWIPSNPD